MAEAQRMADYILGFHPDYAETSSESSDAEDEGGTPKQFSIEAASGLLNCDRRENSSFSTRST
jgi:hypothetical protein